MKALIKKGTIENPVWGYISFDPNGWRFIGEYHKPFIFSDNMTMEAILSFVKHAPFLAEYELIDVEVKPILKDE